MGGGWMDGRYATGKHLRPINFQFITMMVCYHQVAAAAPPSEVDGYTLMFAQDILQRLRPAGIFIAL